MAQAFGTVVLDTPEAKIFNVTVLEDDTEAADVGLMTFGSAGMCNMDAPAAEKLVCEVTAQAATPANAVTISIHDPTIFGFRMTKTSVAVATGFTHTFRIYLHSRSFFR